MGRLGGILLVAVIVAFLAGLTVGGAAELTGNAAAGAWEFVSTFFSNATDGGEAVG